MNLKVCRGRGIEIKLKNKNNVRKFTGIIVTFLLLVFAMFLYYRLYIEANYSTDYNTIGTVTKMELEADIRDRDKWSFEIEYENSQKNKVISKYVIYDESNENKKLEIHNIKVGTKIKIVTEEGFAKGFLGKRFLYSTVSDILEN